MNYLQSFLMDSIQPSENKDTCLQVPTKPTKPPSGPGSVGFVGSQTQERPEIEDVEPDSQEFGDTYPWEPTKPAKPVRDPELAGRIGPWPGIPAAEWMATIEAGREWNAAARTRPGNPEREKARKTFSRPAGPRARWRHVRPADPGDDDYTPEMDDDYTPEMDED